MNPDQTPPESDAMIYRRIFADFRREIETLKASHEALLQTLFEMEDVPKEKRAVLFAKYEVLCVKHYDDFLKRQEDASPSFAAEIDKHRPPFYSSGESKSP